MFTDKKNDFILPEITQLAQLDRFFKKEYWYPFLKSTVEIGQYYKQLFLKINKNNSSLAFTNQYHIDVEQKKDTLIKKLNTTIFREQQQRESCAK